MKTLNENSELNFNYTMNYSHLPDISDHHIDVFIDKYETKCIIDLNALRRLGTATYRKYQDGSEYYGELVNGLRHGKGTRLPLTK